MALNAEKNTNTFKLGKVLHNNSNDDDVDDDVDDNDDDDSYDYAKHSKLTISSY